MRSGTGSWRRPEKCGRTTASKLHEARRCQVPAPARGAGVSASGLPNDPPTSPQGDHLAMTIVNALGGVRGHKLIVAESRVLAIFAFSGLEWHPLVRVRPVENPKRTEYVETGFRDRLLSATMGEQAKEVI